MSEKAAATAVPEKASSRGQGTKDNGGLSSRLVADNPFLGLQQSIGNQATLRLLDGAVIQTKLRVSQPGDADEQEADRIAAEVVSSRNAPTIQRKCACSGGTPCAKCASEEEETIHRSVQLLELRSAEATIQRAPAEGASPAKPHHHGTHPLVVEDDAKDIEPHQMRKSQFIALLRTDACATADAVLMSVGHTTKGCPYIAKWLSFYEKQNSHHIEAAMQKYAPETARARSAHEAVRLLTVRIQKAATSWAKTGKVEGLSAEIASQIKAGKSLLEKAHDFATTGVAGAIFGFIGGKGKKLDDAGSSSVMRKARTADPAPAHDVASVRSQLGTGHSLDSRVQTQMSSAFGYDFSGVRVHTDSGAAKLSTDLQARAFTIGNDVAFASNEYRPGTLIGDALIAHELAHVVQQRCASTNAARQQQANTSESALEQDASRSTAGVLAAIWRKPHGTAMRGLPTPQLRSGLALQRCSKTSTGPSASGPHLKKTTVAGPTDVDCGGFSWGAQWSIDNPGGTDGFVVQHVEVTFDVKDCAGHPVDVKAKTGVDPAWWPIWEAWEVRTGSVFVGTSTAPHKADTYGMTAMGDSTKGSIKIVGHADYYPGLTLPSSFVATNKAPAWALPVTQTDPALSGGTGPLDHNLTATWNCCPDGKDKKTKVTPT